MKTIFIKIAAVLILAAIASPGKAQSVTQCAGDTTVLIAPTSMFSLTNISYSLNPGGITAATPNFTVAPTSTTSYTLYTTGLDSNLTMINTSKFVTVQVASLPVASLSSVSQTIGCGAGVLANVTCTTISPSSNVTHKWYSPASSNAVSFNAQVSTYPMSVFAGHLATYTCVVVDNTTGCSSTQTTQVTSSAGGYPSFNLMSYQNYSVGCTTFSLTNIQVANANADSGAVVSFTLLPPGYSGGTTYTASTFVNVFNITSPGTYTVIVKDNNNSCESRIPVSIIQDTSAPNITANAFTRTLTCTMPSVVLAGIGVNNPPGAINFSWSYQNGATPVNLLTYSMVVTIDTATALTNTIINIYTLTAYSQYNGCSSRINVPMWQNIRPPVAMITAPLPTGNCFTGTVILVNSSTTGILPNTFPILPITAELWQGPYPQQNGSYVSTYVAQTSGLYTLTVRDTANGCAQTATYNVNIAPAAAFVYTLTGTQAIFNNVTTGTNSNTAYYWNFGDGSTTAQENPVHTYSTGGAQLVVFKVSDPTSFCSDSTVLSVNVSGLPCSANSNFSMVPTATAQVWDVIPDYPWNVTAATWNWGDGTSSNTLYGSHQYATPGLYNICLSVTVSCVDTSTTCTSSNIYRVTQQAMFIKINVVAPALVATGVTSISADDLLSWNIAPNPNSGEFNLNLNNSKTESLRIVISDLTGRMVHDQFIERDITSVSINTSRLPSGMYLVTLESGGLKATKRMIISH